MLRVKKPLTITGTALAAGAIAITALAPASAMSRDDLSARLQKQGYTVSVDANAIDHPTLDVDGRVLTISKDGKSAKVEILDYGSGQKLRLDWAVENGKAPAPKDATNDFAGRVLMWNTDSVLLVDYRAPNDAGIAKAVTDTYLQRTSAPVTPTTPPTQNPNTPKPPSTGNGSIGDGDDSSIPTEAVALGLVTVASVSGIALTVRHQRRR